MKPNRNPNSNVNKKLTQQKLRHIWENEPMEWKGVPKCSYRVSILEMNADYDPEFGATSLLGFFFALIFIPIFKFYMDGNWLAIVGILVSGAFLLSIPDIFRHLRKKNTAYAFNHEGVFFKLWRWGDSRIHFVDFVDVDQINCVEYDDGKGIISLISQKDFYFKTDSLSSNKNQVYPILEMVENASELSKQMEKFRQMRIATTKAA